MSMKKTLLIITLLIAGFSILFNTAYAIFMPFGGKIVSMTTPGIVCPGAGPGIIAPYNVAPPTPYYVAPGTPSGYGLFPNGAYVLGAYSTTMLPVCVTAAGTPYVVFPIIMYSISTPTL